MTYVIKQPPKKTVSASPVNNDFKKNITSCLSKGTLHPRGLFTLFSVLVPLLSYIDYAAALTDSNLSEKHEGVVGSEVLGEELHTMALQSWDCIFLCCVQSRHHSLWTNMDLVGIQKPAQQK